MEKGTLIEFRVQGEYRLAVADRPEGKKDWIVLDGDGHAHKIRPQKVDYTVSGSLYEHSDIPSFKDSAESYLDPDSLEVAWEILVEDNEIVTPKQLAELLFSEQNPVPCYAAYSSVARNWVLLGKQQLC